MTKHEHHVLCLGVLARCYEHVPVNLKLAIYEGIAEAALLGIPVKIPKEWENAEYPTAEPQNVEG